MEEKNNIELLHERVTHYRAMRSITRRINASYHYVWGVLSGRYPTDSELAQSILTEAAKIVAERSRDERLLRAVSNYLNHSPAQADDDDDAQVAAILRDQRNDFS